LAASFPVILGIIGDKFASRSGTAFGVALTIALTGNIIINYGFGIVGKTMDFTAFPPILAGLGILTFTFLIISTKKNN
jgi:nicotinamide riboside transporter PnuC